MFQLFVSVVLKDFASRQNRNWFFFMRTVVFEMLHDVTSVARSCQNTSDVTDVQKQFIKTGVEVLTKLSSQAIEQCAEV